MAKLNSTEQKLLKEVEAWKNSGPGFLSLATHFATKPLIWAADKLIPAEAQDKMSTIGDVIVDKLQDISQWTVSEEDILKSIREFELDANTIVELKKASVFDLIHVSEEFTKQNTRIAMAEGFGTGLLGWPGLIADLPALFTLCFRLIYQTSLSYGYRFEKDPESDHEPFEVGYMLRVFRVATASTLGTKTAALEELDDFQESHPEGIARIGGDYTRKQIGKAAGISLSRALINQIVKETFGRKAITSIPGIGAVLTAGFNYYYVSDVGKAASMLYRERFLLDKMGRKKVVHVTVE
jgi:hypothetical protein